MGTKWRIWDGAILLSLSLCAYSWGGEGGTLWRSTLYPADWTPSTEDAQGRFLHDFSYAGYHNGEAPLPDTPVGNVYDAVADFGADKTGSLDATAAIQQAIDAAGAAGGGVVFLPTGLYRCDGQLNVLQSHTVLRGAGEDKTYLYFTKVTGMSYLSHISFNGSLNVDTEAPLVQDGVNRASVVYVADASGFAAGDDISVGWVITPEFVAEHGMTGVWVSGAGTWRDIFQRTVVSVDTSATPNAIRLDVPLRYPAKIRDQAAVRKLSGYLSECGMERLAVGNAVDYATAWTEIQVHLAQFSCAKDCWVRNVVSFAPPGLPPPLYHLQNCGILFVKSKRGAIADCELENAQNRGSGGCGYLFEVSQSSEILIRDCIGNAGRHNFIQNYEFGTSGCVFLRCTSMNGLSFRFMNDTLTTTGTSEYHHRLAMACLVDNGDIRDGWTGGNRGTESTGAGHSTTQCAYWNLRGGSTLKSWAYGWGYVIGTKNTTVTTQLPGPWLPGLTNGIGTEPEDHTEGLEQADFLLPHSLYEDQLARRLGRPDTDGDGIADANEASGINGFVTDPDSPDTDGDGLADGDEVSGRYGPATRPTEEDSDGDGRSDYDELFVFHSNPTVSDKGPTVSSLAVPFFVDSEQE